MNRKAKVSFVVSLLLGSVLVFPATDVLAEKLPVFKLKEPKVDKTKSRDLFMKGLGGQPTEEENERAIIQRTDKKVLEVDKRSGHIFMGDMEKLWNPRAKANVPEEARAKDTADNFLQENGLLPEKDARVRVSFSHHSQTMGADDNPGQMTKQLLDRQVNYKIEIAVKGRGGEERLIPVSGGGGKFKVSVGDQGAVIGFLGGWREIEKVESEEEILPQESAEAQFKKSLGKAQVKNVRSQLAYYATPAFEVQSILAPVWIVSGEIQIGQETIPLRNAVIPATKFGPRLEGGPPAKPRDPKEPQPPADEDEERGKPQRSRLDLPGLLGELLASPAYAASTFECGTSWIGPSQGLSGSPGNKQGFVDQCRAAGWTVNFDWGEAAAFESDWRRNDDLYVDAVDLVFYTGHASGNGWVLNPPDDTFLHQNEVTPGATAIDLYGNTDLDWLIIAACGPHQSTHFTTNTTNAFDRWRGIFDGLHVFLGYGAVTFDNSSEGRRFMELARAGWNVIDAWFRTAQEIQPSTNGEKAPDGPTIWVTAMYAHNGDHCARNDHLWGMGNTCPDATGSSQQRYLMWSGT